MDGDITPLTEMVQIAKEFYPRGNANFIVDEAHATGLLGHQGCGLVGMLGLHKEIAIRVHTFSKALASYGGMPSPYPSPVEICYTYSKRIVPKCAHILADSSTKHRPLLTVPFHHSACCTSLTMFRRQVSFCAAAPSGIISSTSLDASCTQLRRHFLQWLPSNAHTIF